MKISWETFARHRRVNLGRLIENNHINDYEQLTQFLAVKGVQPPDQSLVLEIFKKQNLVKENDAAFNNSGAKDASTSIQDDVNVPPVKKSTPPKKKRQRKSTKVKK